MTIKQLQSILLWLRKERITYTTITVGNFTLDGVVDGKHASPPVKQEPRKSMFEEYGSELLKQPATLVDNVPDEAKLVD